MNNYVMYKLQTRRRDVNWTVDKVFVVVMVLLVLAIVAIVVAAPQSAWNPTCYNGYRYNRDAQGVMWPIQTKHGVQKCLSGDVDVSR